jgi:hypothetical protein
MPDKTRLSAEFIRFRKFVYIEIPEEFPYNYIYSINSGSACNAVCSIFIPVRIVDQHTRAMYGSNAVFN